MSEAKGRIWGPTTQIAPQAASGLFDAFGRMRVSSPNTIFDSKHLYDKNPLFWDESITNASGNAASTHIAAHADVQMHVEPGDAIIRQTFSRWNYQPGKSTMIFLTSDLAVSNHTGIVARVGQFDASNGLFFEYNNEIIYAVIRNGGVDNKIPQADWNIDHLDGTGVSRFDLDPNKCQIVVIDYEWLGVGSVRFGFVFDGALYYCHVAHHANIVSSVYMATPNLPLRYEVSSAVGSGSTADLSHICSTVIVEGGSPVGINRSVSTGGVHIDANVADTVYAMLGIRLKTTHLGAKIKITDISTLVETNNAQFEWFIAYNPTVAVVTPLTWVDMSSSAVQYARGVTANTVTADSWSSIGAIGWTTNGQPGITPTDETYQIGSTIGGTSQTAFLCVRPLTANQDIQGSLTFREFQ